MEKAIEYYKLFFKELWRFIKTAISWKSGIIALLSLIVGGFYYLATQGWNAMIDQTTNFIAFTLAPLGLVALLFLFYGFIKTPVGIYQELKTEAYKRTWRDVEIKPFRFPANSGLGVGLEILSNKSEIFKINNVYCQINEITHSYDVEFRGNLQIPLLSIPSFQRTLEIINRNQATQLVSGQAIAVANNDESRAWIQKNDTITDMTIENGIWHKLKISIDGNVLDVGGMDRCSLYCDLLYDKNEKTGKMELQLQVIEREPKYEK